MASRGRSILGERDYDTARAVHPGDPGGNFTKALGEWRGKVKAGDSASGDPQVGVGCIHQFGCRSQEAGQQATLKNHKENGECDPEHRDRKPNAVMENVLPG